jgi:hypothetical protein
LNGDFRAAFQAFRGIAHPPKAGDPTSLWQGAAEMKATRPMPKLSAPLPLASLGAMMQYFTQGKSMQKHVTSGSVSVGRYASPALLIASLVVAGCVDPAQEKARALDVATERCESQGKQLHVINLSQQGNTYSSQFHTSIDFECVGPGETGYVPPASK